jgi:SPP1 family predicted phage head-tail adaptor
MVQCCDITTASLTVLVVIERRVRTADGQGGWVETWTADPAGGVWAKVAGLSGTERWEAGRTESTNLYSVYVRFRGDANGAPYWNATDTRISVRGRYHNVLSIVDMELKKKWLRFYTQEGDIS